MTKGVKRLTEKQLDVLKLLHRFYFVTSDLVALSQGGISRASANARLISLADNGFINKTRTGRERIEGRSVLYSLTTEGRARVLGHSQGSDANSPREEATKWISLLSVQVWLWGTLEPSVFYVGNEFSKLNSATLPKVKPHGVIKNVSNGNHAFVYFSSETSPAFSTVRNLKYPLALPIGERPNSIVLICESETREKEILRKLGQTLADGGIKLVSTTSELLSRETGVPIWFDFSLKSRTTNIW